MAEDAEGKPPVNLLPAPTAPIALLPAICSTSQPAKRRPQRKQAEPVVLPEKPANWSQLTQRERTRWYSDQCIGIETTEDRKLAALQESLAKRRTRWPWTWTEEQIRESAQKINFAALVEAYYG